MLEQTIKRGVEMREILFRGKRKGDNKWVYGSFARYNLEDGTADMFLPEYGVLFSVHIDTLGQFTGLIDKNGKKIFEHDIVRCEFNSAPPMNGKVVFENGAFGLRWKHHGSGVENFAAFECICNVEYTVIGNIHDNPELMEV